MKLNFQFIRILQHFLLDFYKYFIIYAIQNQIFRHSRYMKNEMINQYLYILHITHFLDLLVFEILFLKGAICDKKKTKYNGPIIYIFILFNIFFLYLQK